MKKTFLIITFMLSSHLIFCQGSSGLKFEYVLVVHKATLFEPRALEIIYPDGRVEHAGTLAASDVGKNLYKNLSILLKVFNYLGDKGYELIDIPKNKNEWPEIGSQYYFRRKIE